MFTGLIESTGVVRAKELLGESARLEVSCGAIAEGSNVGDSIAVNGCCLTAVTVAKEAMAFDVGIETLRRTSLGGLAPGDRVNLERSLRVGDRMGGHFVTGHVDAVIRLLDRVESGEWATFWFELPASHAAQVASQGSVALDGISLTVVEVHEDRFSIMLIPHTLQATTFGQKRAGDRVNLETDVLAKYVQRIESSRRGEQT